MPVDVQASIEYTMGGQPSRVKLPSISLGAREVKRIELREELERRGITGVMDDAGIDISYDEMPGTVIARLTSYDRTKDYSFDVPIKDPKAGPSNGGYPWRLDGTYSTVLHLKNTLDKDARALFKLSYGGGEYNAPPVTLAPYQTVAVDIRKLRDAQTKDLRGNVMPTDAQSGKVMWIGPDTDSIIIGRAEVANIDSGIASSFSCTICDCGSVMVTNDPNYYPFITPSSLTVPADANGISFGANEYRETWCDTNVWGPVAPSSTVTWTSSNVGVATVSGQTITLVTAGTTTIRGSWSDTVAYGYNCAAQQGGFGANATLNVTPKITGINPPRGLLGTKVRIIISGTGLADANGSASVQGETGLDVNNVDNFHANNTQISADMTIAGNVSEGNHTITVTVSGQSSTVMFYVQKPKALVRQDFPSSYQSYVAQDSTGISRLLTPTDGSVIGFDGQTLEIPVGHPLTHQCGGYRLFLYQLVDAQGNAIKPGSDVTVTINETFTDQAGDTGANLLKGSAPTNEVGYLQDLDGMLTAAGNCLSQSYNFTQKQHFSVTVGSITPPFPLTTIVQITLGFNPPNNYTVTNVIATP